jgi:hypothetical protein
MPVAPIQNVQNNDGMVINVKKGGGTSRSAVSGRFVSREYEKGHKSTTVKHRKY